jgi:methylated-DNA-[protein]-cysteine S-methyltransferase
MTDRVSPIVERDSPANEAGFALFETAIGPCGIAWGPRGIVRVQLPEGGASKTRARLALRFPAARETTMPPEVANAAQEITLLLRGQLGTLSSIALDMDGLPPFHRQVYQMARGITPGTTVSYGDLAARLGRPGAARAVGQALGRNPFAIVVPCHRVLAAGRKVGGFSASGGVATKLRLLSIELDGVRELDGARELDTARELDGAARPEVPMGALEFDPMAAVAHLRACDPALARLIDSVGPPRLRRDRTSSLFAALAQAIVYQQLNGRAAAMIFSRVRALFPIAADGEGPTAAQIHRASDVKLRGAGLSRGKLLSLRDLAARTLAGDLPSLADTHGMTDDEIIERLTAVRGIGRWTVEMLLIFRLGRGDVLPVDDYGVRKGFSVVFGRPALPSRDELAKRGARWSPYRSVASWYLWRAAELPTKPAAKSVKAGPKTKTKAKTKTKTRRGSMTRAHLRRI